MKRRPLVLRMILLLLSLVLLVTAAAGCETYSEGSRPTDEPPDTAPDMPTQQTRKKRVALTFDDGPQYANEGANTVALVDALQQYGFHATFFVVGNRVGNGSALRYAVEHGNEIGIHGYTHEHYYDSCTDSVYQNELERTRQAIVQAVPTYEVRLMRPVGGKISDRRIAESPYSVVMWSVDSNDWQHRYHPSDTPEEDAATVAAIVDAVMASVRDGSIILMHDIYQSTYDATVILLQRLYEEGYDVVTVSELFENSMMPGSVYREADPVL